VDFIVNENNPFAEGVPLIIPVEPSKVRPSGREPPVIVHVYGGNPPVLVKVAEYGTDVWPSGRGDSVGIFMNELLEITAQDGWV